MNLLNYDRLNVGWPVRHTRYRVNGIFQGWPITYFGGRVRLFLDGRERRSTYKSCEVEPYFAPGFCRDVDISIISGYSVHRPPWTGTKKDKDYEVA